MKLNLSIALMLIVLATSGLAQSQKSLDSIISDLQRQIQARETIDRDTSTGAQLRALNRRVLEDKRTELRSAVQTRIGQLQSYLSTLGPSATPEERRYVETSLRHLQALIGGVPISSDAATTINSMRPRVIGQTQTSANTPSVTPENQNASSIRLEPVREGDSIIRGWSPSNVNEIVVEIRTRDSGVQNSNGVAYSHTTQAKQQSAPMAYRVVRFSGRGPDDWAFTVRLPRALTAAQEIRAIPNGATTSATAWAGVGGQVALDPNPYKNRDEQPQPSNQVGNVVQPNRTIASVPSAVIPTLGPLPQVTSVTLDPLNDTSNEKIAVRIVLNQNSTNGDPFVVTVVNDGKEIDKKELVVAASSNSATAVVSLKAGSNTVRVAHKYNAAMNHTRNVTFTPDAAAAAVKQEGKTSPRNTIHTRAIVGLEHFAASSANQQQKLFVDFNVNVPFGKGERSLDSSFWIWANPRITSLPKPTAVSTKDITSSGNFFNPVTEGKAGDITQGFEFVVGGEVPIIKPTKGKLLPSGFGEDIYGRMGLSFIFGGGAIAPFNPQATAAIFKVNQGIIDQYPGAQGKEFIAFIAEDRDRFFRHYFAGVRLKTYFFQKKANNTYTVVDRFPGLFDITFGQNESVTGGRLRGGVLRLEGFYPMPFYSAVHIFGGAVMKLTKGRSSPPLILEGPATIPALSDPKVHLQTVPPVDRDYYRIGIGIDLLHLKKAKPVEQ